MIEIIPATDIIDGRCVRLTQGDYTRKKTYCDDPLEAAGSFLLQLSGHLIHLADDRASSPVFHHF